MKALLAIPSVATAIIAAAVWYALAPVSPVLPVLTPESVIDRHQEHYTQAPAGIDTITISITAPEYVSPGFPFMVALALPKEVGDHYRWGVHPEPSTPPVELLSRSGQPMLWVQGVSVDTTITAFAQVPKDGLDPVGSATHVIHVGDKPDPPGPEPDPEPNPDIPPDDFGNIGQKVNQWAAELKLESRNAIAANYEAAGKRLSGESTPIIPTIDDAVKFISESNAMITKNDAAWGEWASRVQKPYGEFVNDRATAAKFFQAVAIGLKE